MVGIGVGSQGYPCLAVVLGDTYFQNITLGPIVVGCGAETVGGGNQTIVEPGQDMAVLHIYVHRDDPAFLAIDNVTPVDTGRLLNVLSALTRTFRCIAFEKIVSE